MSVLKYNPKPRTETYRIAVFNATGNGVAEFETLPGQTLDQRHETCQSIADQIPQGYTLQVFLGVHTIGRTTHFNRKIQWN